MTKDFIEGLTLGMAIGALFTIMTIVLLVQWAPELVAR